VRACMRVLARVCLRACACARVLACKVHSDCVQAPLGAKLGKYSDIASVAASCLMLQWRECIAKAVSTLSTPALR
jgi:hypothetical protein